MSISVKYFHLHYTHLTKFIFSFLQTALAPRLHSLVPTSAVCLQHGAVMATMTALITAMSTTVLHGYLERVPPISSLVPTTTASLIPGAATQTMTVGTVRMKPTVVSIPQRVGQLTMDTQLHRGLNFIIHHNCCLATCGRAWQHVPSRTVPVSRPPLHRPQLCV